MTWKWRLLTRVFKYVHPATIIDPKPVDKPSKVLNVQSNSGKQEKQLKRTCMLVIRLYIGVSVYYKDKGGQV